MSEQQSAIEARPTALETALLEATRVLEDAKNQGGPELDALRNVLTVFREQGAGDADGPHFELLRRASHELREPCALINGYGSMIRDIDHMSQAERTDFADIICRVSGQMMATIGNLADIDRILGGTFEIDRSEQSLSAIIEECGRIVAPMLERKAQILSMDLANLDQVMVDPLRIHQVVKNLIENASKFTAREGSISITLQGDGDWQEIIVADNGQGIAEGEMGRLFEPFSRTSTIPTDGEHCSGLGLALCRAIVTSHGGTIRVESAFGKGTTVTVRLPMR